MNTSHQMNTSQRFTELSWPVADKAVRDVFLSMFSDGSWGRYHGPHCNALIAELAQYHHTEHVILCSSGTSAVELALRGVGVGSGDEVILSAYDFKANFLNVLTLGATPVLIDTLPGLPVMDCRQLNDAITDRTRAVICSHLHGCLAPVKRIVQVAEARGVAVVEDACQAPGALIDGSRVGTLGTAGTLSFGGSKLLTAGRGGAVLTRDAAVAQRIRLYTQRGNDAYPLSEMQAAVLLPQLRMLDECNLHRFKNVQHLRKCLAETGALQPLGFPPQQNGSVEPAECSVLHVGADPSVSLPVFYKVAFLMTQGSEPIRQSDEAENTDRSPGGSRDSSSLVRDRSRIELQSARARDRGLPLDPGFPALHRIHSRRRFRAVNSLDCANELHDGLMIMHHPVLLCGDQEMQAVSELLAGL